MHSHRTLASLSRPSSTPSRALSVAQPQRRSSAALRAAEVDGIAAATETEEGLTPIIPADEEEDTGRGGRRGSSEPKLEFKHFLPLPKPAHLIYIKPTVAVVAGMAARSSVGLKMTANGNQLERYVIEYYSKSVK